MNSTPEMIAEHLFNNNISSTPNNIYQLLLDDDVDDLTYVLEVLSIIMLEGIEILYGDLRTINLDNLTLESILNLNKWFEYLGFVINCELFNENDESNAKSYSEHYAKIYLNQGVYTNLFIFRNLNKNYHFILNGNSLELNKQRDKLNELYICFMNGNIVYKISFDFIKKF